MIGCFGIYIFKHKNMWSHPTIKNITQKNPKEKIWIEKNPEMD